MALRSLHTCYTIDREPLTEQELKESSEKLHGFMEGFHSRRLQGNRKLQEETGIHLDD